MNSDNNNPEIIYWADDDEYRIYCGMCYKLVIERHYKNHLNQELILQIFVKENT